MNKELKLTKIALKHLLGRGRGKKYPYTHEDNKCFVNYDSIIVKKSNEICYTWHGNIVMKQTIYGMNVVNRMLTIEANGRIEITIEAID